MTIATKTINRTLKLRNMAYLLFGKSDSHRVCAGKTDLHNFGKTIKPSD